MEDDKDTQDDLFDEDEGTDSDSGSGEESSDDSDAAPPESTKGTKKAANSDKRVNDLMSKWQSAEAEKKRLAARIAELEGSGTSNGGENRSAPQSAEANEFLELAREQARTSLFQSDPRLAQYGFEVSAIEGTSAKDMQASLKRLLSVVERVESSARSNALREFGLSPEVASGGRDKGFDPMTASDEEIAKMADRMLGRL